VRGLRDTPAAHLAAISRHPSLGSVAALFVERDQLQPALADTPLQASAAMRRQPPFDRMVLPACHHA
jgi:hypothetical protein